MTSEIREDSRQRPGTAMFFSRLFLCALAIPLCAQSPPEFNYGKNCAACHENGKRGPSRQAFRQYTADRVLASIEKGSMVSMAANLIGIERRTLAEWLTGKELSAGFQETPLPEAMCKIPDRPDFGRTPWNGWGQSPANTRYQPNPGFPPAAIPRLAVKWAFALPGEHNMISAPALAGGRLFFGSPMSIVYSLDAATGCIRWWSYAKGSVRGAIRIELVNGRYLALFGDSAGNAYALDAATGKEIWRTKTDDHPLARIIGSVAFHRGRVYVPLTSTEEMAQDPKYECCKFRGSVVALDAATGKQLWKTYTIANPAKPTKRNQNGTQLYGPSGAAVWTGLTIDAERNAVIATTGNNYSGPASPMSDAFVSLDLDSGKVHWWRQTTPYDIWRVICTPTGIPGKPHCASDSPMDFDFASSASFVRLPGGRGALVALQKSGVVHAVDAATGTQLWSVRVAKGGEYAQWGSAADDRNVYAAIADIGTTRREFVSDMDLAPDRGGGLVALRLADGRRVWSAPPVPCGTRTRCSPGQVAAVSVVPGAVFSGSLDGHIRAYSTANGQVVWDFDTHREFKTVNKVPGAGGSINGPGPIFGEGMMFLSSGFVHLGGAPGNVLLAFSVDGK